MEEKKLKGGELKYDEQKRDLVVEGNGEQILVPSEQTRDEELLVVDGNARPPEELTVDPKTNEPKVTINKENEREEAER